MRSIFFKRVMAWLLVIPMMAFPAVTMGQSSLLQNFNPNGVWAADAGDARYDVALCGDGTQICVKLIWIKPDQINERNIQLLNKYVIYEGKRAHLAEWRGKIDIYGMTLDGSVKILGQNKVKVTGCAFGLFCEGFTLSRMS
ncbi:MAG TPA: DUF2147 domain-containing protein [Devosia sp.]|nr:DUF2147 domain-containing protein [Devosia sp.]